MPTHARTAANPYVCGCVKPVEAVDQGQTSAGRPRIVHTCCWSRPSHQPSHSYPTDTQAGPSTYRQGRTATTGPASPRLCSEPLKLHPAVSTPTSCRHAPAWRRPSNTAAPPRALLLLSSGCRRWHLPQAPPPGVWSSPHPGCAALPASPHHPQQLLRSQQGQGAPHYTPTPRRS